MSGSIGTIYTFHGHHYGNRVRFSFLHDESMQRLMVDAAVDRSIRLASLRHWQA
jgi:hypothetical protein